MSDETSPTPDDNQQVEESSLLLDEFDEKLAAFKALRKSDSPAADELLSNLGAQDDVDRDIVLELASKRPLGHPERFPQAHTMAVRSLEVLDRNGARLWKGAMQAIDEGLDNVVFLRDAAEQLDAHVPPGRVVEIWIPFPDPLPKNRQARHRLTAPPFLERYRRLLAPGGAVHLKTDDAAVLAFTERAVRTMGGRVCGGSNQAPGERDETAPQSTYERRYRRAGRTIYQRVFRLDGSSVDAHRDQTG